MTTPRPRTDLLSGPDDPLAGVVRTAAAIRAGELSSVEAVTECLRRIDSRAGSSLHAFITVDAAAALAEARSRDERRARSGPGGPLDGVPIAVKDNLATAGLRTTGGTALFADWMPAEDAEAVVALRAAGAVVLGKTNMHEAAFGITSNNPHYGAVRNPYDPDRIPGGSSGGSAAAVAAGICPGSLGTDTGGSCRIPAALCGVVGFKPSIGRVGTRGLLSLSRTTDVIGPIVPTVRDARLLFAALVGDAGTLPAPPDPGEIAGVRLARLGGFFADTSPEVDNLVSRFLDHLSGLGTAVTETTVSGTAHAAEAGFGIVVPEAWTLLGEHLRMVAPRTALADRLHLFGPDIQAVLAGEAGLSAAAVPAQAYLHALWHVRPALQRAFRDALDGVDFLVCATTPAAAVLRADDPEMTLNGARVPTFHTFTRHCFVVSMAGLPAISLPVGVTAGGLPVGVQLIARHGEDERLLHFAEACEAALE